MHDSADFTLRITVTAPEQAVDDYGPTRRFARTEEPVPQPRAAQLRSVPHAWMLVTENELPKVMAPSIPSPTAESAALRMQARAQTPRATPLSDDEDRRVQRRM